MVVVVVFGGFDGGEEFSAVEGSEVDTAVAAAAEEGGLGEAVGGGGEVGVVKDSYWGVGFLEVGVAGGDCGIGIAREREVTH